MFGVGMPGLLVALAAAVASAQVLPPPFEGETPATLDLLRFVEGGPRIYVQAELPGGRTGLFLVDTGADISVLNRKAADATGITFDEGWGQVQGLSGSASTAGGVLPYVRLGGLTVPTVEVAVDVPGLSDSALFMPLDGILGNNVWSRFVVEIDYPADTLVLHAPDTVRRPRRSAPMHFDGHHIYTPVEVTTGGDLAVRDGLIAQLDTGASELTVCRATGARFADATTEGLEPVRGIGASETLPPYMFLRMTRRIPVDAVTLGGRRLAVGSQARWLGFDDLTLDECDAGFRALMGHDYFADHRMLLDYENGWVHLGKSRRPARQLNGHGILHAQELALHGVAPERALLRGKLLFGDDREDEAVATLEAFVAGDAGSEAERAEARVLLARLHRLNGDLEAAWAVLAPLSPADLVDQDQIVASVNGLAFEDRTAEALALAREAVAARPDEGWSHVALADALLHGGDPSGARDALLEAARLEEYPEAHLVRRARVALAVGDRHGAMSHVRKLQQLYPHEGQFIWFYALLVEEPGEAETFRADLEAAMARLHPFTKPYDFLVAAYRVLGDDEATGRWMAHGLSEHCEPMPPGPQLDNCTAWYWSLAGEHPDASLERIDRALAETGDRADFLDTKAMVHVSRGELELAREASLRAARLLPEDPYMLWQAERIGQLAARDDDAAASP